jgi:hypothetical protein
MVGVSGMRGLMAELEGIEGGVAQPYPYYCVLLATDAPGADARVTALVDELWQELDAITGEDCAVFCLREGGSGDDAWARAGRALGGRSSRGYESADVYLLAGMLGVPFRQMPAAVFFVEPHVRSERLPLPITAFSAYTDDVSDVEVIDIFRMFADAMRPNVARPAGERLEAMRAELFARASDDQQSRRLQNAVDVLNQAAETVESTKTLAAAGGGIGVAILRIFGIV